MEPAVDGKSPLGRGPPLPKSQASVVRGRSHTSAAALTVDVTLRGVPHRGRANRTLNLYVSPAPARLSLGLPVGGVSNV